MLTLRLLGLVGTVMLALAMDVRPGAAMVIYPWCVQYGGISSSTQNCGFTSFNQCLATASGNHASCSSQSVVHALSAAAELSAADTAIR